MPKLPSWKFHEKSFGHSTGETVDTRPSKRSKAETSRLAAETKARFDAAFPKDFTERDYAKSLIASCVAFEPAERSVAVNDVILKLLSLERLCYAYSDSERAAYFRSSKRIFVSEVFTPVLTRMEDGEYRKSNYGPWSKWLMGKAFADVSDFWFWSSLHDRLEDVNRPIRHKDFPLIF